MTTAVKPAGARETAAETQEATPADVFVTFGITGDLAKQMTFRSLYRLERRGLLDCPIVSNRREARAPRRMRCCFTRRRTATARTSRARTASRRRGG